MAQKAQEYGYHPEIILAGHRLNDSMGPYVATEVMHEYGIKTIPEYPSDRLLSLSKYAAIILAVAHQEFLKINLKEHKDKGCVIYDVKGIIDREWTDGRL